MDIWIFDTSDYYDVFIYLFLFMNFRAERLMISIDSTISDDYVCVFPEMFLKRYFKNFYKNIFSFQRNRSAEKNLTNLVFLMILLKAQIFHRIALILGLILIY